MQQFAHQSDGYGAIKNNIVIRRLFDAVNLFLLQRDAGG